MRNRFLIVFFLILATLAVYWPLYSYEFVNWDDAVFIYGNPNLNPASIDNTLDFWKSPQRGLYIPLTGTAWSALAWLSQFFPAEPYDSSELAASSLNPGIFHTANLIVHIFSVLTIFSILRLLLTHGFRDENITENRNPLKIDLAAGAGALIFALHPVQVEPVVWASEMKDLLCGLFSFLTIREYLAFAVASRDGTGNKSVHYIAACALFLLALFSKPAAVVVPLVIFILDRWVIKRDFKKSAYALIGWFIVAGLFAVVAKTVQQTGYEIIAPPLWARPFIAGDALAFYFYKLVFPFQLGIDYGRKPAYVLHHFWGYATWLVPVSLLVLTLYVKRLTPFLVPLGIFVASLLPVLGFIEFLFQNTSTVADHYLYFPMLAVVMAVSMILLNQKTKQVVAIFGLIIVLLAARSSFQVRTWKDETTLFKNTLRVNPASIAAYNNMGIELAKRGKLDEAISNYEKVLKIWPEYSNAYNNIGLALMKKGKPDEAISNYEKALKIHPNDALVHYNLGVALNIQGNFDEAILQFKKAIDLNPGYADAYHHIGMVYAKQGRLEEAASQIKQAVDIKPYDAGIHNNLAVILAKQGKYEEAIPHYLETLRIAPDFAPAKIQMERARARLRKK